MGLCYFFGTVVLLATQTMPKSKLEDAEKFPGFWMSAKEVGVVCGLSILAQLMVGFFGNFQVHALGEGGWLSGDGRNFQGEINSSIFILSIGQIVMAIWKFVLVMSDRSTEEISRSPLLLAWLVGMALIVSPNATSRLGLGISNPQP